MISENNGLRLRDNLNVKHPGGCKIFRETSSFTDVEGVRKLFDTLAKEIISDPKYYT